MTRRITLKRSGLRAVFETEMVFRPGPYDVVLVAQENVSGRIATGRLTGSWPGEPDERGLGPLVLLQPATETFVRGDDVRSEGSLAVSNDDGAHADRPIALVGLVCRSEKEKKKKMLVLDRTLRGARTVTFPALEVVLDPEPCAQVRDVIPEGTLGAGEFTYELRIAGTDVATTRTFQVVAP